MTKFRCLPLFVSVSCMVVFGAQPPTSAVRDTPVKKSGETVRTPAQQRAQETTGMLRTEESERNVVASSARFDIHTISGRSSEAELKLPRTNVRPQVVSEHADILLDDVRPNQLVILPETSTVNSRYPDGHAMRNALAGVVESCSLEDTKPIYSAKLGSFAFRPGRGRSVADDLVTELVTDCTVCSLKVRVTGGVADGDDTFRAETWLFDGCPSGKDPGQEIPGTFLQFSDLEDDAGQFHDLILDYSGRGICNDGASCLVSQQNCTGGTCPDQSSCDTAGPRCADGLECISSGFVCVADPLEIPSTVWLRLRFDTDEAAVVSGSPPTEGFSLDGYDDPKVGCTAWFGGWPKSPHATFFAEILAPSTCETCPPGSVCTESSKLGFCTCEPVPEACCLEDFSCQNLPPEQCHKSGGEPRGPGTSCHGGDDCAPPVGSCCADGDCLGIITENECIGVEGQWTLGENCLLCYRACCLDGECVEDSDLSTCTQRGGTWHPHASCVGNLDLPGPMCKQSSCSFFNGPPLDDFGAPASQYDDHPANVFSAEAADDFVLVGTGANPCIINEVRFWVTYFNSTVTPDPLSQWTRMTVTIYDDANIKGPSGNRLDDGTFVGSVVATQTVPIAALVVTPWSTTCNLDGQSFQVDVPVNFSLLKNHKYWITLQPHMDRDDPGFGQTALMLSTHNNGHPAQQIFSLAGLPTWQEIPGNSDGCPQDNIPTPTASTRRDLAFELFGEKEPIRCEQSAPTCGGDCPLGLVCTEIIGAQSCGCVESLSCESLAGSSCESGTCPAGEECTTDPATGLCGCQPTLPPAGTDLSPGVGILRLDALGVGIVDIKLVGDTLLAWQDPQTDPVTGVRSVQWEILAMELSGSHPSLGDITLRAGRDSGLPPTLGVIVPAGPDGDFPALATFDVFLEVEVIGTANLRNGTPLVMRAEITELPPRSVGFLNDNPVVITDIFDPILVYSMQIGFHWMCPPPFPVPGVACPVPCAVNPFPVCGFGDCPPSTECVPDAASDICTCQPIAIRCDESEFPVCDGECPPDSVCTDSLTDDLCTCQSELEACCLDDGRCINLPPGQCRGSDGAPRGPGTACRGESNPTNGIDDACEFDTGCGHCGPGPHWIDTCPAGHDRLPSGAVVGVDTVGDCLVDRNLVMFGPTEIARAPGLPHQIVPIEMVAMKLTGGGVVLRAGAGGGVGPGAPLGASLGKLVENSSDPSLGDSSFEILFELDLGAGLFAYNQVPLLLTAGILCVSPNQIYSHLGGCIPLFDSPIPGVGNFVANLVTANHDPFGDPLCPEPILTPCLPCVDRQIFDCVGSEEKLCWPRIFTITNGKAEAQLCDCFDETGQCGPVSISSNGEIFSCDGSCPGPTQRCELHIDGSSTGVPSILVTTVPNDAEVTCECPQVPCQPTADGLACESAECATAVEVCKPRCLNFDPVTGEAFVFDCDCRGDNECFAELGGGDANACTVADDGTGTADLPPQGCHYFSPEDALMIIDGLPAGATIQSDPDLHSFICRTPGATLGHCGVPGGPLGGESEMFDATLELDMNGTGALTGFGRHIVLQVMVETASGPRSPGDPSQSFPTDLLQLQGELLGDPDFDQLTIVAGTDFGLPSPGQTTLKRQPSGDFAVDSFFDITYRIDFVGAPGGQLDSLAGSTTARARIQTGFLPTPSCLGVCQDGTVCEQTRTLNTDGTFDLCCDCVRNPPEACCLPGGECVDAPPDECQDGQGISRGPGTSCNLPGDLDGNGHVSLSDWALFAVCTFGPTFPPGAVCVRADLNCDGVVDLRDVEIFQVSFGP